MSDRTDSNRRAAGKQSEAIPVHPIWCKAARPLAGEPDHVDYCHRDHPLYLEAQSLEVSVAIGLSQADERIVSASLGRDIGDLIHEPRIAVALFHREMIAEFEFEMDLTEAELLRAVLTRKIRELRDLHGAVLGRPYMTLGWAPAVES